MMGKPELNELRRMMTNATGEDRSLLARIINEIAKIENANKVLTTENAHLKRVAAELA